MSGLSLDRDRLAVVGDLRQGRGEVGRRLSCRRACTAVQRALRRLARAPGSRSW